MIVVPSYERFRHVGDGAPADAVGAIELRFDHHRRRSLIERRLQLNHDHADGTATSGASQRSTDTAVPIARRAAEDQRHLVANAERVARHERIEGQRDRREQRQRQRAARSIAGAAPPPARSRRSRSTGRSRSAGPPGRSGLRGSLPRPPAAGPAASDRARRSRRSRTIGPVDAKLRPRKKITVSAG